MVSHQSNNFSNFSDSFCKTTHSVYKREIKRREKTRGKKGDGEDKKGSAESVEESSCGGVLEKAESGVEKRIDQIEENDETIAQRSDPVAGEIVKKGAKISEGEKDEQKEDSEEEECENDKIDITGDVDDEDDARVNYNSRVGLQKTRLIHYLKTGAVRYVDVFYLKIFFAIASIVSFRNVLP